MTTVILIRHATHTGPEDTFHGRSPDIGLSCCGNEEARSIGEKLESFPVSIIHTSPRRRALETARILGNQLGHTVSVFDALDEIDGGLLTSRTYESLKHDQRWLCWNEKRQGARLPGGEDMARVRDRLLLHLEETSVRFPSGIVVAVSHAEPIRALLLHVRRSSWSDWQLFDIPPAALAVVHKDCHGWHESIGPEAL